MRKYLAIILGLIFILSFASVASAEPEITLGGKILIRGWYLDNVGNLTTKIGPPPFPPITITTSNVPVDTESQALYTTNVNITFDAKVSDNVHGFIELETSGSGSRTSGLYYWGSNQDTKPDADFGIRQAWIQYTGSGLLGVPSGLKAGHMLITLGEKQFLNNERFGDDAILLWVDPTKELHLALGTAKLHEGKTALGSITNTDDIDGYILLGTYMIDKNNTIGANYTWIHSDGFLPSLSSTVPNIDKLNFHNIGVHANGNVVGLTYAAEADVQFGTLEGLSGTDDRDFEGWAIMGKLGYTFDPLTIRASAAYGSGDDSPTSGDIKEFQTLQGPDEIGPLARFVHYTQIYERTLRTTTGITPTGAAAGQVLTGTTRNTGIANTTYYNLGIDVSPVKELTLSLDGFLIYASETKPGVDDNAGTELDFKGTYKIAKNLSYFVEAAGFWPGDYYKDTFGVDETVTQVVHGLLLTF